MNCQKCKIEIEERDLRRERLSSAAEAHLSACASCRIFGEERLALKRLVGSLEKVSAPADFDFRMRARMAAENRVSATRARWFNFSPAALSWPLAGCLALVVSAALYFQRQQPDALIVPTTQVEQASTLLTSPTPQTPQTSVAETTSQTGQSQIVETQPTTGALSLKNSITVRDSLASRRRVVPERAGGRTIVEAAQIRERVEEANSASLMGSHVRFAAVNGALKSESVLIPVQVSAQERPLKVFVRDTGGEARTISVESVSFGSRDVIGRPASISKASLSTNQGVW
jgi:hypothetical protein